MTEIICAHRWSVWSVGYRDVVAEGKPTQLECRFRICHACNALQWENEPEPDVVIGRMRQA